MQVVKDNNAFNPSRNRTISFFKRGDLHFTMGVHFCFVCGAADAGEEKPPSLRRLFLDFVQAKEPTIVCVRAENAVTDLLRQVDERRASKDLSVIEEAIAETVDSLLLFPESAGSFAELGLFSANEKISQKMLVAVEHKYQGDSFIILGPVKRINSVSSFSPQPMTITENTKESFGHICTRLLGEERRARSYAKRFSHNEWKEYGSRERLSIIDKLLDLTGILTEDDLFDIINKIFGKYEKYDIRLLVALLATMGRVKRNDMGDIIRVPGNSKTMFIDGAGEEAAEIKALWLETYKQHLPDAALEMLGATNEL